MQGIIKTRQKRVQLNYSGNKNMPVIYGARPRYHTIKLRIQLLITYKN